MKRLCLFAIFILYLSIVYVSAAELNPINDYQALLDLNVEFSKFRRPQMIDGIQDYSRSAMKAKEKDLKIFRKRLADIDPKDWTISEKIDYLLMKSKLNELDFQLRVTRPWERDPSTYTNMVARIPYVDTPLQKEEQTRLVRRLKTVTEILEQGKTNLTDVPRVMAEIAIRSIEKSDGVNQGEPLRPVPPEGTIGWYRDLIKRLSIHHPELQADAELALSSIKNFRDWLKENKSQMTAQGFIGLDHYNWYLKNVRLMPYTVEDVIKFADVELYRTLAFLNIERHKNRKLPQIEPATTEEEHKKRVREAENLIREFVKEHNLMTIPDYMPSEFETDAFWIKREGGKRHFWEEITYRDPLNNHIHASIPGHRFDGLIQRRHKNPIRRSHEDGGRSEGWTFYIEEMFLQAGLLDKRPRTKELFYIAQLKRVLRIPAELKMQSGEFSLKLAIKFLMDEVPMMDENLARYDLEIYIRRPAYGMTYLTGKVQMEKLLADRARQLGKKFDLGKFHDEFLAYGPIPISLIRWEMTGLDDEVKIFWQE